MCSKYAFHCRTRAATQGEKLCRNLTECPAVPIMGCVSRLPLAQLSEIQIAVRLVPLYLEFDPADEPILQKKPMGLAECTLSSEESVPTVRAPASAEFRLIWTLMK